MQSAVSAALTEESEENRQGQIFFLEWPIIGKWLLTNALIEAINYPIECLNHSWFWPTIAYFSCFPPCERLSAHVQGAGGDGYPRLGLSSSLLASYVARDPGDHEDNQLHLPKECQGEAFWMKDSTRLAVVMVLWTSPQLHSMSKHARQIQMQSFQLGIKTSSMAPRWLWF